MIKRPASKLRGHKAPSACARVRQHGDNREKDGAGAGEPGHRASRKIRGWLSGRTRDKTAVFFKSSAICRLELRRHPEVTEKKIITP
jgi:hypothetical protein